MGSFDFDIGLEVARFLFAVWGLGRLFQFCRLPTILGQLLAGIVLGPNCLDMVPYASNGLCPPPFTDEEPDWLTASKSGCDGSGSSGSSGGDAGNSTARMLMDTAEYAMGHALELATQGRRLAATGPQCHMFSWDRWTRPDNHYISNIWTFTGNLGVTLMIMESGMHIHFDKVAAVGKSATLVAIVGTGMPILCGWLVVYALWNHLGFNPSFYPYGFAAGCAFAPTSVGISIKLLSESKMLNSLAGQTTLTAAFIDDVFSLVTLVILHRLASPCTPGAVDIIVPLICSFGFLALGVFLAIKVFPHVPKLILSKVPIKKNVSIQPRDECHLFLMFCSLAFFGWVSARKTFDGTECGVPFIGSHLLGAFVAGMCWVNVPRSQAIWQAQLKRVVKWMMRIFFAATVGFAVPVGKMFEPAVMGRGLLLGVGPCVSTKLFSGVFARQRYQTEESRQLAQSSSWAVKYLHAQPQQLLVGIAMVARGEFAYLVAYDALILEMLSEEVYASVIWALVIATFVSPFMFRWALGVFDRATPVHRSTFIGGDRKEFARRAFVIRLAGHYSPGVQREIFDTLHAAGVDILEARLATVRADDTPDADIQTFVNNFTVLSRGKKKDFDDDKLEEMQHTLAEVLNDADAQIIFEPYDEDFSADGIIEVQVLGEHHPAVLHEITDKLAELGLDVIKASVHHSHQPGHVHHEKSEKSEKTTPSSSPIVSRRSKTTPNLESGNSHRSPSLRRSKSARNSQGSSTPADVSTTSAAVGAELSEMSEISIVVPPESDNALSVAPAPTAAPAADAADPATLPDVELPPAAAASEGANGGSVRLSTGGTNPNSRLSRAGSWMNVKLHSTTKAGGKLKKVTISKSKSDASLPERTSSTAEMHPDIGREVFYARESDGSKSTSAKRRNDIRNELHKVLELHHLHGEILVRLLHESEMAIAHSVPRLDNAQKQMINIVRCMGNHHKELLHEICDVLDEQECDVVHADMDTTTPGFDVNVFYIQNRDMTQISVDKRKTLKELLLQLYASHSCTGEVTVELGTGSPPPSPSHVGQDLRRGSFTRDGKRDWTHGAAALSPLPKSVAGPREGQMSPKMLPTAAK